MKESVRIPFLLVAMLSFSNFARAEVLDYLVEPVAMKQSAGNEVRARRQKACKPGWFCVKTELGGRDCRLQICDQAFWNGLIAPCYPGDPDEGSPHWCDPDNMSH